MIGLVSRSVGASEMFTGLVMEHEISIEPWPAKAGKGNAKKMPSNSCFINFSLIIFIMNSV